MIDFILSCLSLEPWEENVVEGLVLQLTSDGFKAVADSGHEVGIEEHRGTFFVSARVPGQGRYSIMAFDQEKAKTIYEEVVDPLLAA